MHGYPIEQLIGELDFAEMIWLMLRGELPTKAQAALLTAALVASVDHGPQAPSIAIARMAATCGVGLNGAMASAIGALGDVHGGAGQQCLAFYDRILADSDSDARNLAEATRAAVGEVLERGGILPGFGHRFHSVDPRAIRLLELAERFGDSGRSTCAHVRTGREVERCLAEIKGRTLPMNIDGATAVVFGELGFPPELARGLFILSRSVGILAHAWEQTGQGERIKGPMPPSVPYSYDGPPPRDLPARKAVGT